jgi:hypothetical protein
MKVLWLLWLAIGARGDEAGDRAAVQKTLAAFNDSHLRAEVLAAGADVSALDRYSGPEVSQMYFELKAVRFVTPEVALADATGSQYGTLIMKRSVPALFVLRKEAGTWHVVLLRWAGR